MYHLGQPGCWFRAPKHISFLGLKWHGGRKGGQQGKPVVIIVWSLRLRTCPPPLPFAPKSDFPSSVFSQLCLRMTVVCFALEKTALLSFPAHNSCQKEPRTCTSVTTEKKKTVSSKRDWGKADTGQGWNG